MRGRSRWVILEVDFARTPLLQLEALSPTWTLVWLAAGGFLLVMAVLAFAYLLARRQRECALNLLRSPILQKIDRFLSIHLSGLWRFLRARFVAGSRHGLALTVAAAGVFSGAYLFALVTESWAEEDALYAFDQRVYEWLVGAADGGTVAFMGIITHFADGWAIALIGVAAGLVLLAYRRPWQVVSLVISVGVGSGIMHGLKWVFERSRPTESVVQVAGHSFPSGHAFMATTMYGWLIYLTWQLSRRDVTRISATIALSFLIFLIGTSRVLLRVHWASDVAGGFTVGFMWLALSVLLTRVLQFHYRPSLYG